MKEVREMTFKFDANGNIIGDFLVTNLQEVEEHLVRKFKRSYTRSRNYESFVEFINFLKKQNLLDGVKEIWFDGSFCTSKTNPNDIDFVIILKPFIKSSMIIAKNYEKLKMDYKELHLDMYVVFDCEFVIGDILDLVDKEELSFPDEIKTNQQKINFLQKQKENLKERCNYWHNMFGFDRQNNSKAILILDGGEL